jgi:hypothetical protein
MLRRRLPLRSGMQRPASRRFPRVPEKAKKAENGIAQRTQARPVLRHGPTREHVEHPCVVRKKRAKKMSLPNHSVERAPRGSPLTVAADEQSDGCRPANQSQEPADRGSHVACSQIPSRRLIGRLQFRTGVISDGWCSALWFVASQRCFKNFD